MRQAAREFSSSKPDFRPYRLKRRPEERAVVLGAAMDFVRSPEVFHLVDARIAAGERAIIANHNLHSLYLARKNARLRSFYEQADLVEVDSTPLIWWARLLGHPSRRFHRCTYLDWREEFWGLAAAKGWRVFFVGGEPGVAERACASLRARWPGVELACRDGYFDVAAGSVDNEAAIDAINVFAPDILLVGMGMPRQELWVLDNHARLKPCAIFTVGAAFDYEAGVQTAAPRWLGRLGAEWLFRLARNPARMVERYCIEPWGLVGPALSDLRGMLLRQSPASH